MNSIRVIRNPLLGATAALATLLASGPAAAALVTCGSSQRIASVDPATSCEIGLKNPKVDDINSLFGDAFTDAGELTGNGTDSFLSVMLTSGSWGASNVTANFTIDSSFWSSYSVAVLSTHVGNGGGDPDFFAWSLEYGATSGTFSYKRLSGKGGGLSNLRLWGAGEPVDVPAPGALALLGLGLLGLGGAVRRRRVA